MSTIQDTIWGVFHMFTLSSFIMNTEHSQASCLLLQRLIVHAHHVLVGGNADIWFSDVDPHIPDISTMEGTPDLFILCIFAELGELLEPTAYAIKTQGPAGS
jgi:hypothetical protein